MMMSRRSVIEVVWVIVDLRQRVLEHRRGLSEGNAVLEEIGAAFAASHSNVGPAIQGRYRDASHQRVRSLGRSNTEFSGEAPCTGAPSLRGGC
jgi:hypothetical protein